MEARERLAGERTDIDSEEKFLGRAEEGPKERLPRTAGATMK
jgi:hypothetical protein